MAARGNVPACCRGKSPPTAPSPATMQALTSTPSCCQGAPAFSPSPSPIAEPSPAGDYNSYQGDASASSSCPSSYSAGQDSEWRAFPYRDQYQHQEEFARDGTDGSSEFFTAESGRCPSELLALPPLPTQDGGACSSPFYSSPSYSSPSYSSPSYSSKSSRCPGEVSAAAARTPPPTPAEWNTPVIQRRRDPIRRFSCKRRLTFHDVKEWVISGTETLDAPKVDELRGEPPPGVMLEYQSRELAAKPDDGCMETIYGPLPQHKYVPLWVYLAREDYPEVFQEALSLYFERTGWPELGEMDEAFQAECERAGVSGVAFRKTVGFAPVWIFILDIISKANWVDRRWFDTCVDDFFEYGSFPELSSMPEKLLEACEKMDVTDYDFYVPDM